MLSRLALSYLRGKRFEFLPKRQGSRTDLSSCHCGAKSAPAGVEQTSRHNGRETSAERLGAELNAGARTIHRDAKLAGPSMPSRSTMSAPWTRLPRSRPRRLG